jgi:hypothetical protein
MEVHAGPGGRSDPRSVALMRAGDIIVDQRVQRDVRGRRVSRIAENWDWSLAEAITVTPRPDGTYVATEGQNRVLALQERDAEALIWCVITADVEGAADEASTALGIARGRQPHNRIQQWRMSVTAGHPHEIAAEAVLADLGLRLAEGTSASATHIACAGVIAGIIHGTHANPLSPAAGAARLRQVLSAISAIPVGEAVGRRTDAAIVQAVGDLIARHPDADLQRLAEKLSGRTAVQWLAFRRSLSPTWRGVEDQIARDYNHALSERRRLV